MLMFFVPEVPRNHLVRERIEVVPPGQEHVLQLALKRITRYFIRSLKEFLRFIDEFVWLSRLDSVKFISEGKVSDRLP